MMDPNLPELTSFGTLLKFALALEESTAERAATAADGATDAGQRERLSSCGKRHARRARELERMRRERLNEVVLQPISGMDRERYLPPDFPAPGGGPEIKQLQALEETIARFYDDAATIAGNVLPGLDRKLRKLADESRRLAAELG